MTNKTFTFVVLSILAIVAAVGFASAVSLDSITQYTIPTSVNQSAGTFNIVFNLRNTGEEGNLTWTPTITSGASIAFNDSNISNGSITPVTETIKATVTFPTTMNGTITGVINVTGTGMSTYKALAFSVPIRVPAASPLTCAYSNTHDNLRIKKIDITNNGFSGTEFGKDDEWFPIDEISVEITIENRGEEKIEDIELEWGLYDTSSEEWVIELDSEDEFDVKSDKTELITVDFSLDDADVDLEDLNDGTYEFYVRATGYDTEFEEDVCVVDSEQAEVIIESDFVVLSKIEIPESTQCDSEMLILANVYNIGDDDQEGVYVNVYNKDLKIDQDFQIGDVDAFSYEKLNIMVSIPAGVAEKTHTLVFSVYDEDDDIYVNDYDDQEATFKVPAKITCGEQDDSDGQAIRTVVSAALQSGGKAGEEMVVKATITNLEDKTLTYSVSSTGYSNWASSSTVDQDTFTVNSGESKTVLITFAVEKTAVGEQTFELEVSTGGRVVTKQPVSVQISKAGFQFPTFAGNNYLWAIALINIILVIAIIIVAIKVMRR